MSLSITCSPCSKDPKPQHSMIRFLRSVFRGDKRVEKKQSKKNKQIADAIGIAYSAFEKGNFELAQYKFEEAITLNPKLWLIRIDFAVILERWGRFDDAIREYDRMLELDPDYGLAWRYKANVFVNCGLYEEAVMCADNALRLDIKDGAAWGTKGVALEMLRKLEEALKCFDEQILLLPAEGNARKGNLLVHEYCDLENGQTCLDKALQLDQHNGIAWNGKGLVYFCLGLYDEAIECYEKNLKEYPNNPYALNNKGEALFLQGKLEEAEKCFQTVSSVCSALTLPISTLGFIYLQQGRFQDALKYFEKVFAIENGEDFAVEGKAICEYLMTNPRPPTCPNPSGKSLQKLGLLNLTELYFYRGRTLLIFGELEESRNAFEKCLELNPNYKAAAIEIDKIQQLRTEQNAQLQNSAPTQ